MCLILNGERGRNRTFNLVIKSHLLCQLSYAPVREEWVGAEQAPLLQIIALGRTFCGGKRKRFRLRLSSPAGAIAI